MRYTLGDLVYPADLLRPIPCRVARVDACHVPGREMQILWLEPLEGPWTAGTLLVRTDDCVHLLGQVTGRAPAVPFTASAAARIPRPRGSRSNTRTAARRRAAGGPPRIPCRPAPPATPLQ